MMRESSQMPSLWIIKTDYYRGVISLWMCVIVLRRTISPPSVILRHEILPMVPISASLNLFLIFFTAGFLFGEILNIVLKGYIKFPVGGARRKGKKAKKPKIMRYK